MNNQHDSIVTFTEDGKGGVNAEAATVIEFNEGLLTHRMADAVAEMHVEIAAKARGEFTDGERYRAIRALQIIANCAPELAEEIEAKLDAFADGLSDDPNEAEVDKYTDHLITLLNAKRDEVLEQRSNTVTAKPTDSVTLDTSTMTLSVNDSPIIIPGARKLVDGEGKPIITDTVFGALPHGSGDEVAKLQLVPETTLPEAQ